MRTIGARTLIAAGLLVAAGVAACGAVRYRQVASRRAELAALTQRLSASNAAAARYRRAAGEVPRLRAEHRRFVEQAPLQPDLGRLLERVGEDSRVEGAQREIVTQPVVAGHLLNRTPILLRFRGSADRVLSVLRHIENHGLLTRIERVSMEQSSPGTEQPLAVQVEFSLFSRSSEEALSCTIAE
jgi:hypothetical protein